MKLSIIVTAFVVVTTGNLALTSPFNACSKSHQEILINKPVSGSDLQLGMFKGIHVGKFCLVAKELEK